MNIKTDYDLISLNTFKLHSKARYFVDVHSDKDLAPTAEFAKSKNLRMRFLGGGSNLILPETITGLVVKNSLHGVQVVSETATHVRVKCASGENWHSFVMSQIALGHFGLENLALIPGTVGGAPIQNIGAYGVEVNRFITQVTGFDFATATVRTLANSSCQFEYRHSIFKTDSFRNFFVTSVEFELLKKAQPVISYAELATAFAGLTPSAQEVAHKVIEIRQKKLPDVAAIANVGSFFKNPIVTASQVERLRSTYADLIGYPQPDGRIKLAAGQLIDKLGYKGKTKGTVGMYGKQALVMVNLGEAKVEDVNSLASEIVKRCQDVFGVELETEPIFW